MGAGRAAATHVVHLGVAGVQPGTVVDNGDLLRAKVIRQIDHKFICCTVASPEDAVPRSIALVVVDQHAADERISVENILRQLCVGFQEDRVTTTVLPEPKPLILINSEETRAFESPDVNAILRRWGVHLELVSPADPTSYPLDFAQLRVLAVPTALQSRLGRTQASEMARLVSLFLRDADDIVPAAQSYLAGVGKEASEDWTRVLGYMPREMLELANSKACRSEST